MWQQLPGTATTNYIEDSIDDFTPSVFHGTATWFGGGYQRLESVPFGVGQIGVVGRTGFHRASVRNTFSNALSVEEEIPWKCKRLVIGSGTGALPVMEEVKREAKRRKIKLVVLPTAEAIEKLRQESEQTNAILHVTC